MKEFIARWEKIQACLFHVSDPFGLNRMRLLTFPVWSCFPVALLVLGHMLLSSCALLHDLQSQSDDFEQ